MAKSLRLEDQLCFSIYAAGHAFNRFYKPLLGPLGLTYPQYLVLLTLWEQDGLPLRTIGDRLALDSGTLTPLLKRLEAQGHVARGRDAGDERRVIVRLTAAGSALKIQARSVPPHIAAATGCALDEVAQLMSRLGVLRDALVREAEGASH